MRKLIFTSLLLIQFLSAFSQRIEGIISKITDGDSFEIIAGGENFKVRLNGIDCPEYNQPYGKEATDFVKYYLYKKIEYTSFGYDKYNRVLADVYIDGVKLNLLLVEKGLAWHYKQYSADQTLANKESQAKAKKIGLWSEISPVAPWEWRNSSRTTNDNTYSAPSQTETPTYNNSNSTDQQYNTNGTVIICGGKYATKFHKSTNCRGLNNCKGGLYETTKTQAQSKGRSSCSLCY